MYTPEVLELLQHLDLVALLCAASLVRPPRPLLRVRRLGFLSLQKLSSIFQVSFEFAPQAVLGKWEAEQHTRWGNREGRGGAGGGTHLLLVLVIWPLTTHPFRDGGRENEQRVGCWRFRVWTGGGGCFVFLDAVSLSLSLVVASG